MKFRVHGANPQTGDEFDFDVDAQTIQEAEQKAQDAGMLVNRVVPITDEPSASPTPPPTTPVQPGRITCQVCRQGKMIRKKVHRMSSVVATIGYILLIPSILGIVLNVVLIIVFSMFTTAAGAMPTSLLTTEREALVAAAVPQGVIDRLDAGQFISAQELSALSPSQRRPVDNIQSTRAIGATAGACCGFGLSA